MSTLCEASRRTHHQERNCQILGFPRLKDCWNIVSQFRGKSGQSSKSIFTAGGRPGVPKSTGNDILGTIASVKATLKMPALTSRHKRNFEDGMAQKYLKMDTSRVFVTGETRATLDGPGGCANGWAYFVDERHNGLRRQQ